MRFKSLFNTSVSGFLALGLTLVSTGLLLLSPAATAAEPQVEFTADKVYVFGDVHGAFEPLMQLLRGNGLIDDNDRWSGGSAHLVSVGDMLDRGAQSRDVMDLLRRLQSEAKETGGRVHVVLGNHEVMNLTGDLRDVSDAEFAAFAESAAASGSAPAPLPEPANPAEDQAEPLPVGYAEHRAAFAAEGEYGRWLLSLPVMIKINRILFVHGGLSPLLANRTVAQINADVRAELVTAIAEQSGERIASGTLLGSGGPLWYRGSAGCHRLLEAPILEAQLAALQADTLVIGHTPTPRRRVRARLNARVYAVDTGMLASVYRGKPYLLKFETGASAPTVLNAVGATSEPDWWHPLVKRNASGIAAADGTAVKAGKTATKRAIAQFRLDRELGLWMIPETIANENGKGYVQNVTGNWITERERIEQDKQFNNHCVLGHQNLLVAAFDALIGNTTRTVDTLLIYRATGYLRLAPVKGTFGTTTTLPAYASQPSLPPAMADRLQSLDAAKIEELLGDLLSPRQQSALLKRRDKILLWPRTALEL